MSGGGVADQFEQVAAHGVQPVVVAELALAAQGSDSAVTGAAVRLAPSS